MYSLNEDKDSLESKPIIRHLSNAHNHFHPESEYAQPITPVINSTAGRKRWGIVTLIRQNFNLNISEHAPIS